MIKKIGRIAMFVVAAMFIIFSVFRIKDCVGEIQEAGGFNIIIEAIKTGNWSKMVVFTDMGWGILYILVGLSGIAFLFMLYPENRDRNN